MSGIAPEPLNFGTFDNIVIQHTLVNSPTREKQLVYRLVSKGLRGRKLPPKKVKGTRPEPDAFGSFLAVKPGYGRLFAFAFEFMFELGLLAFEFIFEFVLEGVDIGVLGAIGVAGAVFGFTFALLVVLLAVPSPHAIPRAPIARTAVSAIFFIFLDCSPVFSKI